MRRIAESDAGLWVITAIQGDARRLGANGAGRIEW
jgi:hypothetical protein